MATSPSLKFPTPKEIVALLDQRVIGQLAAKKILATESYKRHISDYRYRDNVLFMGPTGTGKTFLVKQLAEILNLPAVFVDITTFSETGYVGHNVDEIPQMVLMEAMQRVESRLILAYRQMPTQACKGFAKLCWDHLPPKIQDKLVVALEAGELDDIEICTKGSPLEQLFQQFAFEPRGAFVTLKEAKALSATPLSDKMAETVATESLDEKLKRSIVLIDEIDKICEGSNRYGQQLVSRTGVQRSLLALLQGTKYNVRLGSRPGGGEGPAFPVDSEKILFVGAGAFQQKGVDKMSMMPELRGRFGKSAALTPLTQEDYRRIMTQPLECPLNRYQSIFAGASRQFEVSNDGIDLMTDYVVRLNKRDNLGARRVNSVFANVADEVLYDLDKYTQAGTAGAPDVVRLTNDVIAEAMPFEKLADKSTRKLEDHAI